MLSKKLSKLARLGHLEIVVIFLIVITVTQSFPIDCRRYVFAPICRGVSAKRSAGGPLSDTDRSPSLTASVRDADSSEDGSELNNTGEVVAYNGNNGELAFENDSDALDDDRLNRILAPILNRLMDTADRRRKRSDRSVASKKRSAALEGSYAI